MAQESLAPERAQLAARAEALREEEASVKRSLRDARDEASRAARERDHQLADWQARLERRQAEQEQGFSQAQARTRGGWWLTAVQQAALLVVGVNST